MFQDSIMSSIQINTVLSKHSRIKLQPVVIHFLLMYLCAALPLKLHGHIDTLINAFLQGILKAVI